MPPKKRKAEPPPTDTTKSVLGGMKGGYRVDGAEQDDSFESSSVSFQGKSIICQRRGSSAAKLGLIFTHGAGGGLENPATKLFAEGFATVSPILCFQGTMNLKNRTQSFNAVIEHENWGLALGGRSMGARAAVMSAQEHDGSKLLVLVSYPLKSPQGEVRDQILLDLPKEKKVLFVIGDRDNMCELKHLQRVRDKMAAPSWLIVAQGADHGMSLSTKPAVEPMRRKMGALAAEWLKAPKKSATKSTIRWDAHSKKVVEEGAPKEDKKLGEKSDGSPEELSTKRRKR